jgi:hypothetical protein
MPLAECQKLLLLNAILEKKNILFGSFDSCITRDLKSSTWKDILQKCIAEGGFDPTSGNGWKYLRDTVWPNMRQYTVRKKDANSRTGAAGGNQMSQIDNVILDIIGKGSPVLEGLSGTSDVLAIAASSSNIDPPATMTLDQSEKETREISCLSSDVSAQQQKERSLPRKRPPETTFKEKFEGLKLKKMELEIEILQLQRDTLLRKQCKECCEVAHQATQTD